MSLVNDEYPRWTKKQREWFLRRDNGECQFVDFINGEPKKCKRKDKLHLHHIVPHRWAFKRLKWTEKEVNAPTNGIILCEFHHLKCIHPDFGYIARKMYFYDPNSYKKIESWHDALTEVGVPYWWDIWDGILKRIAIVRTRLYLKQHPDDPFPEE